MISSFNFIQVKFDLITKLVYLFKFDFSFFFVEEALGWRSFSKKGKFHDGSFNSLPMKCS